MDQEQQSQQQETTSQKASSEQRIPRNIIVVAVIILIVLMGSLVWLNNQFASKEDSNPQPDVAASSSENNQSVSSSETLYTVDNAGKIITDAINQETGLAMGFISSKNLEKVGIGFPMKITEKEKKVGQKEFDTYPETLDSIIPVPKKVEKRNWFSYPKYKIEAPIKFASFEDLFQKKADGTLNFRKSADTSSIQSPIQRKLQDGIVHLPFSPHPGELGNSYIAGHSSNYSNVPSKYNFVFAPIERKSKKGEEFFIYDAYGRKLKFTVVEALAVAESDVRTAYQAYPKRRIVTLQASILEKINGVNVPTKRWLTRGELVTPN